MHFMTTKTRNPWTEPIGTFPLGPTVFSTAMVTGHRPHYLTEAEQAWSQVMLHHTAWRLRSVYGCQNGISGMALGADTWWALGVLSSGMNLHAYIPFEEQPKPWTEHDKAMWSELRRKAQYEVIVGGKTYDVKDLHARNDQMLYATHEQNGLVVALYKEGESGGTASAVAKARRKGLPLLILDPAKRAVRKEGWS
jgi:hypothetical protein